MSFWEDISEDNRKLIVGGTLLGLGAAAVGAYFFWFQDEDENENEDGDQGTISGPENVTHVQHVTRKGNSGNDLTELDFDADKNEYKYSLKLNRVQDDQ